MVKYWGCWCTAEVHAEYEGPPLPQQLGVKKLDELAGAQDWVVLMVVGQVVVTSKPMTDSPKFTALPLPLSTWNPPFPVPTTMLSCPVDGLSWRA